MSMIKSAILILALGLLGAACATSRASEPLPTSTPTAIDTAIPTATLVPVATATAMPTAAPTDTPEPTATPASAPPVSEVLPAAARSEEPPPASATVRGGTQLPVPEGTTVVWGGCASDGECHWYNFYWAPTHEAVLQQGEGENKVQHELCHAHQHWSISGGAPLRPSDYDLESWYSTAEGASFTAMAAGLSWPWSHSAVNGLEDFAWTCTYWYLDPARLLGTSPERYQWAADNLP
ncbi:MAG: hypothetical protein IIB19_03910 [Chloroflexi bacterium]|nr:hypothetical protein [Chloroflexota bacterium]